MRLRTLFFIVLVAAAGLWAAVPDQAAAGLLLDQVNEGGLGDVGVEAYGETGTPTRSIMEITAGIIRVFLGFLGLIFFVLILVAGFKYMTSAGNEEKTKLAVAQIRNAVIGLVIILLSFAVVSFVINRLVAISN